LLFKYILDAKKIDFIKNKICELPNNQHKKIKMQYLPKEIIIMIMNNLLLIELIKLGSTCKLCNAIIKTTEWKKDIVFDDDKIFLLGCAVSRMNLNDYPQTDKKEIDCIPDSTKSQKKVNNRILEIHMTDANIFYFKQIIENISNITSVCSIVFTPQDEKVKSANIGGMSILHLTENNNMLINLNLNAQNFEYFKCDPPQDSIRNPEENETKLKITINVNLRSLCSAIKIIRDNISIYMNKDNPDMLHIKGIDKGACIVHKIKIHVGLMDNYEFVLANSRIFFSRKITMLSDKFHAVYKHLYDNSSFVESVRKDLYYNSSFVEIISTSNKISFVEYSKGKKIFTTCKYIDCDYDNKPNQVIKNTCNIKDLEIFNKCNELYGDIKFYIQNNCPLVLAMSVGTLGKLYLFIASADINH
jgi:hypothetical protein